MSLRKLKKSASKDDVKDYLKWLASSQYAYHIDDNPEDVIWDGLDMTKGMIKQLRKNTDIMWTLCNYGELWDWYGEFIKPRLESAKGETER